jgi:predicted HicB family RNase H-like nuclease
MAKEDDTVQFNIRIPKPLKKLLAARADREKKSETALAIRALENELDEKPPRWFEIWQSQRVQ